MQELIYAENEQEYGETQAAIRQRFPAAVFTDASDQIHLCRFEVEIDCERDSFWLVAMQEGFALSCLGFNFELQSNAAHIRTLMIEAGIIKP